METAIYVFQNLLKGIDDFNLYMQNGILQLGIEQLEGTLLTIVIVMLAIFDYLSLRRDLMKSVNKLPIVARYVLYTVVLVFIIILSPLDSSKEFIYFQF